MRRRWSAAVLATFSIVTIGAPAGAGGQPGRNSVELTQVADIDDGTAIAARANDDRLYVTEQAGRVVEVSPDGATEVVLDVSRRVAFGGEQGLLGIAISPTGDKLYIHFTNFNGDTRVEEYRVDDAGVDKSSRRRLLSVRQPQANHNGGQLAFGPDGYLYLGLGDGGSGGDEGPGHADGGNGQSLDTLLGKILRIDPAPSDDAPYTIPDDNPFADGDRPEIWSLGLRNPWSFSFDRQTGDLWVADVGQDEWEEVSVVPGDEGAGNGTNFGWNVFEAKERYRDGETEGDAWPALLSLSHDNGNCSVIGGFVYRGEQIEALRGIYLYADYCNGTIRWVRQSDNEVEAKGSLGVELGDISAFGEDNDGELYVLSQSDGLYRIDPA
ncbi:MAG: PQQ-dependent sugar dehydrogenase [Actinobacteria bacterium]|nr:PQQ-dependent sugar dehydrogenase [Actinomycetota bacterium]